MEATDQPPFLTEEIEAALKGLQNCLLKLDKKETSGARKELEFLRRAIGERLRMDEQLLGEAVIRERLMQKRAGSRETDMIE